MVGVPLGKAHIGKTGRDTDRTVGVIRLQSKSDSTKERGEGDWVEVSQTAMQSLVGLTKPSVFHQS